MDNKKYPIKIKLFKTGEMIYFSQIDLAIILERALRRTKLPIYYTEGFRPHPKLSFKRALKVGVEGEEEVIIYFLKEIKIEDLNVLKEQLPSGLEILDISKI